MVVFIVFFLFAQVLLFLIAYGLLQRQKTWYTHTNTWASIVTVAGVLGTFLGISIGLLKFNPDPNKIQESIEVLLGGLRLAFLTSLMGIGSAIALKLIALYQMRNADEDPGIKAIEKTDRILNNIRIALSSTNDGTVFSQLQVLNETVKSSNTQLVQEISAFSDRIAEKCTSILVDALEDVVKNYNVKINEQFGDNFVQLNEAVREINRLQKLYRDEFSLARQNIETSREALESAANSLTTITDQSESLSSIAEKLDMLLPNLNSQLETFSTLRDQALDAFPRIEKSIDNLTTKFSGAVEKAIVDSEASQSTQRKALEDHVRQIQTTLETTGQQLNEITERFSEITGQIRDLWSLDLERGTSLWKIIQSLQSSVNKIEDHVNRMNESEN